MQKLSTATRQSINTHSNLIERIKLQKLTWRTILDLSIEECVTMARLHMVFENRTLCTIRKSTSGVDCCKRLFLHLKQHNSTG